MIYKISINNLWGSAYSQLTYPIIQGPHLHFKQHIMVKDCVYFLLQAHGAFQ